MNVEVRKESVPTMLLVLAALVLVLTLVTIIALPKPSAAAEIRKFRQQEVTAKLAARKAEETTAVARAQIKALTWREGADQVGPKVLSTFTALVRERGLKLVSFRPQRAPQAATVPQVPFLATVEGPYPKLVDLVRAVEKPSSKLAVGLVQLASADETTSRATANISLTAFLEPPETEEVPSRG